MGEIPSIGQPSFRSKRQPEAGSMEEALLRAQILEQGADGDKKKTTEWPIPGKAAVGETVRQEPVRGAQTQGEKNTPIEEPIPGEPETVFKKSGGSEKGKHFPPAKPEGIGAAIEQYLE